MLQLKKHLNMEQKKWLITGVSSGLGKAIANYALNQGDYVIGTFRNQNQVSNFKKKHKDQCDGFLLDISDEQAIQQIVPSIVKTHPRIDVLVNNAGIGFVGAIEETSIEEARKLMDINFFGTLKITQLITPIMRKYQSGHIIQISSHGGVKAFGGFGLYNASKFALEGFSEALSLELAPFGIAVSIIEPGPFRTEFAGNGLGMAANTIAAYNSTTGLFRTKLKSVHGKQEGNPEKAAKAIFELTRQEKPSLRLPLGPTALKTIQTKVDQLSSALEMNKEIAANAIFEN